MMNRNCLYCPDEELQEATLLSGVIIKSCHNCDCSYVYDQVHGRLVSYYFSALHNNKFYRGHFVCINNTFELINIGDPKGWEYIVKLKHHPKGITPFNFDSKIQTLLTFS